MNEDQVIVGQGGVSGGAEGGGVLSRRKGLHGTGIPCTRCVSHTVYLTLGNSKGKARSRSRHKNNSKSVVRNMEESGHYKGKCPKQGLTSAKDLTKKLPDGRASPYHLLEYPT